MIDVKPDMPDCRGSIRLAMIGPVPPPIGGATVSFEALCDFLRPRVQRCILIDTVVRRGGTAITGLATLWQLLTVIRRCDVVTTHVSDRAAITIAPVLWATCRLAGKPFVFRQFGGEFDRTFAALPRWWKWLVERTILRSDAVFLQTKAMMQAFAPFSDNLHWFPTARISRNSVYRGRFARGEDTTLRCLFMGHVAKAKGVLVATQAIAAIPNASLDIFGGLIDVREDELVGARVRYRGIAAPEEVPPIMAEYDLVLFPTSHPGEGYSGTLVEAAMAGLPIVATRWQSLPEMFTAEEAIFIDTADVDELADALRAIVADPVDLTVRSQRLIARAADFDAGHVFGRFLSVCINLKTRNTD